MDKNNNTDFFTEDLKSDVSPESSYIIKELNNIPVLPTYNLVVFPACTESFDIGREKSVEAIKKAVNKDGLVFIAVQRNPFEFNPKAISDLFEFGTVAKILNFYWSDEDKAYKVSVKGLHRGKITKFISSDKVFKGNIIEYEEIEKNELTLDQNAKCSVLREMMLNYIEYNKKIEHVFFDRLKEIGSYRELTNIITGTIDCDLTDKIMILNELNFDKRLDLLLFVLNRETEVAKLHNEIMVKTKKEIDENQRMYFLSEELRVIKEEMGETDSPEDEADEFRAKIIKLHLNKEIEEALLKECKRLSNVSPNSPEANVIQTYLETCLDIPWNKGTKEKIDIIKVKEALDKNHYGLEKVKERILEALAVKLLTDESKGQILCLVGPPGVGKTSIAKSIAKAINRKYAGIALGGIHDEAEIRGHRKTYVGAMVGRIMKAIIRVKSNNPLIVLDEIDKLASDYKGDPSSALLEVLDSEQNVNFVDHYIDLPFDLSKTMFITTANDMSEIPEPLRDRMDIIEIGSYTREEKFNIAKKHLMAKCLKNCGVKAKQLKISDEVIYILIDSYTREAGVRNLERTITKIIRKAAMKIVSGCDEKIIVNADNIEEYLGSKKYKADKIMPYDEIGVATGLAWTSAGGEVLPIEVAVMDGTGKIELTGSLGDVMQESAKTALTCVRTRASELNIPLDFYKNFDIHIHAPEGAVPKDGPSAGITMATAIVSAFTKRPIKRTVAMTGEITLRGRVLPIGGLKEKSMAAYKLGIETVIIPEENLSDLDEVDKIVKDNVKFVPVNSINQVFEIALI